MWPWPEDPYFTSMLIWACSCSSISLARLAFSFLVVVYPLKVDHGWSISWDIYGKGIVWIWCVSITLCTIRHGSDHGYGCCPVVPKSPLAQKGMGTALKRCVICKGALCRGRGWHMPLLVSSKGKLLEGQRELESQSKCSYTHVSSYLIWWICPQVWWSMFPIG